MTLTLEQIKAADDRPFKVVAVPEWGGEVRVGTMTAKERDDYEYTIIAAGKSNPDERIENIRAILVCRCVHNDDGTRMFADSDAGWLGNKGAAAVARVFDVAAKLNRITKADQEELAKN